MLKTFRYRIYPKKDQEPLLAQHFGCVRYLYNAALDWLSQEQRHFSRFELQAQLKEAKKILPWLKLVNSQSLQYVYLCLERAFTNYSEGRAEEPTFKKKKSRQSFHCPQNVAVREGKLFIPKFRSGIPIELHRTLKGVIRHATVSRTPTGKYYVSILTETGEPEKPKPPVTEETAVGIDLGLKTFAVRSDGTELENPRYLKHSIQRLKVLHRQVSRKEKGSNNSAKAAQKLAVRHEKPTKEMTFCTRQVGGQSTGMTPCALKTWRFVTC